MFALLLVAGAREAGVFAVLKSDAAIGRQAENIYLLPTDQLLHPWGEQARIAGRPVDLAFDSRYRVLEIGRASCRERV